MKSTITKILIFLFVLSLLGCTSNNPASEPDTTNPSTIVCEVFYRSTAGGNFKAAPEITFSGGTGQKDHKFENMAFEAHFQDDQFEGRALSISIIDLDRSVEITRQLYQFDSQNPLENQFIGGHGFTGLNYIFHPDLPSEIQYFCTVN